MVKIRSSTVSSPPDGRAAEHRRILVVHAGRILARLDVAGRKTPHWLGKTESHRERAFYRRLDVTRHLNRQRHDGHPLARLRPIASPLVVGGPHLDLIDRARFQVIKSQREPRPRVLTVDEAPRALLPVLHVVVADRRSRVVRFAPVDCETVGRLSRKDRRLRDTRWFPFVCHSEGERLLGLQFPRPRPAPHLYGHLILVVSGALEVRRCPEAQLPRIGGDRELPLIGPAHNRPARHLVPVVVIPRRQPPRQHLVLRNVKRTRTRDLRGRVWGIRGIGHRLAAQPQSVVAHYIPERIGVRCVAHPNPRISVLHRRIERQRHHGTANRDSRNASPAPVHLHRKVPWRRPRSWVERFLVGQRQRRPVDRRAQKRRPDPVHLMPRLRRHRFMVQHRRILRLVFDCSSVQGDPARLDAHPVGVVFVPSGHLVAEHQRRRPRAVVIAGRSGPGPHSQP